MPTTMRGTNNEMERYSNSSTIQGDIQEVMSAAGGNARLPVAILAGASVRRASLDVGCGEKLMAYLKIRRLPREEKPRKNIRPWLNEEISGTGLVSAEVRGGRGESLIEDDRRGYSRGVEQCGYERYVGYYPDLMSEDVSSLHYRCTPSRTNYIKIPPSYWAFYGVPGVKPICTRSKSLLKRWCSESQC